MRKSKDTLPDGCILAIDFARNHGIARETFRDHQNIGIGPKGTLIHGPDVPEDGSVQIKDWVRYEERQKPGRPKEKERYLTADQQHAALLFWQRHSIGFSECDQPDCGCHDRQS